jgi:hypothetical protein
VMTYSPTGEWGTVACAQKPEILAAVSFVSTASGLTFQGAKVEL